jgi:hypothetical protein
MAICGHLCHLHSPRRAKTTSISTACLLLSSLSSYENATRGDFLYHRVRSISPCCVACSLEVVPGRDRDMARGESPRTCERLCRLAPSKPFYWPRPRPTRFSRLPSPASAAREIPADGGSALANRGALSGSERGLLGHGLEHLNCHPRPGLQQPGVGTSREALGSTDEGRTFTTLRSVFYGPIQAS